MLVCTICVPMLDLHGVTVFKQKQLSIFLTLMQAAETCNEPLTGNQQTRNEILGSVKQAVIFTPVSGMNSL